MKPTLTRRGLLLSSLTSWATTAYAHNNAGAVVPSQRPPKVELTLDDERSSTLDQQLSGRVTAVQLIFTQCQATCPIQGAIFGQAVKALGDTVADAQWLSISIDPAHDEPTLLRNWMQRFGAHPRWRAARPTPSHLEPLLDFLKARAKGPDRHTAQVYFFDRKGALVLRTVDFPPVAELVRVLRELGVRG